MNGRTFPTFRVALACAVGGYGLWAALHALGVLPLSVGAALGLYWPALVALYALLAVFFHASTSGSRGFYAAVVAASVFLLLAHVRAVGISSQTVWQLIIAAALIGFAISLLTGHGLLRVHTGYGRPWSFVFDSSSRPPDPNGSNHSNGSNGSNGWNGWNTTDDAADDGPTESTSSYVGELKIGSRTSEELRDRRYHQGMGDIRMDLSSVRLRPGETHIVLECGMGEIQLLVPEGMAVRIRGQVRIGEVTVFGRSASGMGPAPVEFVSDGYDEAERRVRVDMACGMGEVTASWVR